MTFSHRAGLKSEAIVGPQLFVPSSSEQLARRVRGPIVAETVSAVQRLKRMAAANELAHIDVEIGDPPNTVYLLRKDMDGVFRTYRRPCGEALKPFELVEPHAVPDDAITGLEQAIKRPRID